MSNRFCVAACALAVSSAACSIDVRGDNDLVVHEELRFTVSGAAELDLRTFDGAIDVRTWDREEVVIDVQRRAATTADAKAIEVTTRQDGPRIVLEALQPTVRREGIVHLGGFRSPSVSFVVTAPRRVAVRAASGDGPIQVREVTGSVMLQSGDGPVRVDQIAGEMDIRTGDGPIALEGVQGAVSLTTGDGQVVVSGVLSGVRISTGDGPVRVDARTGSTIAGEWSVHTGDGPIELRLPTPFDAELDAFSGDGPITLHGQAQATRSGQENQTTLRAPIGGGGAPIRLRTGDGPITVTQ
jgi:DUF4097 and DUF4098 domain-containing protein YvlB